jgi:hypothetical protein
MAALKRSVCVMSSGGVAAVAGAVDAKRVRVRDPHVDQAVGRRRDALHPRLARSADDQVHRRVEHGVAVPGQQRRPRVEAVVEERLVDLEHGRVLAPLLVVHRIAQHAVELLAVSHGCGSSERQPPSASTG